MATNPGFFDHSVGQTYRLLRYLAAGALIGMPLLVAAAASLLYDLKLMPSLSDYYYALRDGGLPRALFIIFLAFLGGVLLAYRGLTTMDNRIHNFAGLSSICVALFPLSCNDNHQDCVQGLIPQLHAPAAIVLFLSAAASVIYSGGSGLKDALAKLPDVEKWQRRLFWVKLPSLVLMSTGIVAYLAQRFFGFEEQTSGFAWIYWIEYGGFLGFGIYWIRYMWLINDANKEGARAAPKPPGPRLDGKKTMRIPATPAPQWEPIP